MLKKGLMIQYEEEMSLIGINLDLVQCYAQHKGDRNQHLLHAISDDVQGAIRVWL